MLARLWRDAAARADVLLASAILGLAVLVVREAAKVPPPFFDPLGSAAIPRLLAGALAGLATLLILARVLRADARKAPAGASGDPVDSPLTAAGALIVICTYVATMQAGLLAFREATMLVVLALGALLGRGERRRLLRVLVLAVVAGIAFDVIFTKIFYVDLPQARG